MSRNHKTLLETPEPGICPRCGSDDIFYGETSAEPDNTVEEYNICLDCNLEFISYYRFSHSMEAV